MKSIKCEELIAQARNMKSLISRSEIKYQQQIEKIAKEIVQKGNVRLVLLAGPSASGKTTTAKLLGKRLEAMGKKVKPISTDDFFKSRDQLQRLPSGNLDFDSLDAMNVDELKDAMSKILMGEVASLPRFDFKKGISEPGHELFNSAECDVVIIEGIHALNPLFLEGIDIEEGSVYRIFAEPKTPYILDGLMLGGDSLRLIRRMIRDCISRGHTFDFTFNQWSEVALAEKTYIRPYEKTVDAMVDTVIDYEILVYRSQIPCIIEGLTKGEALSGIAFISRFLKVSKRDYNIIIPEYSLLKEFVEE